MFQLCSQLRVSLISEQLNIFLLQLVILTALRLETKFESLVGAQFRLQVFPYLLSVIVQSLHFEPFLPYKLVTSGQVSLQLQVELGRFSELIF